MSDDSVVPLNPKITAENAYHLATKHQFETEEILLGPWSSWSYLNDPKHICFVLSRYKFVAKMLEGKKSCLEVGPGDGPGLPLLSQTIKEVYAVDWDSRLVEGNKKRLDKLKNIHHLCYDLNKEDLPLANIDAAVTVDLIEHIDPNNEDIFIKRILKCLHENSILITGTPNSAANQHASPISRALHINLKSYDSLRELTKKYCENVFMFSMNDETIHTGFGPMSHYIWSIGSGIKRQYLL